MNRKVLLIEPNYKNKYPPMGLMKLATYFRLKKDDVRFFKGDLRDLAAELICEDLLQCLEILSPDIYWRDYWPQLLKVVRNGKYRELGEIEAFCDDIILEKVKEYRKKYQHKDYFVHPRFDKVCVTTLFTFYWGITIDTINFAKQMCKSKEGVLVGGIMSTLHPDEVFKETGIYPIVGLLDKRGIIDNGDKHIIDQLPLDYSILDETDYIYPTHDAYFAYTTRGCINRCAFCAVPILEPKYCDRIKLKNQIESAKKRFGEQRNLMLLDNNVLASKSYNDIIEEIEECGFGKNAMYLSPNTYDVIIQNLNDGYNDRAYVRKAVKLYKDIINKLSDSGERTSLYLMIEKEHCLNDYTATKEAILRLDHYVRPMYEKTFRRSRITRVVDFNQGIDSRLVSASNMAALAKLNIHPLRIAFDHWELRDIYEKSIRTAVQSGIRDLSNYLLYNFMDKPEHLYYRLRLNIDLCEELDAKIYSFPMKYHPINDPNYFRNRDYIGKHWNRKFIRAIQAVLNSTKGKIGRGVDFFEEAFGKDVEEFRKILWMPEPFIIYRRKYDANLRNRMSGKYGCDIEGACDLTNEWWDKFNSLTPQQLTKAKKIIANNKFTEQDVAVDDNAVSDVLKYYRIARK